MGGRGEKSSTDYKDTQQKPSELERIKINP